MKKSILLFALGAALLNFAAPCSAAPVKSRIPAKAKVGAGTTSKPQTATAPGSLKAKPAGITAPPTWSPLSGDPTDIGDPEVCTVPLERGHCPIG